MQIYCILHLSIFDKKGEPKSEIEFLEILEILETVGIFSEYVQKAYGN
jgi:hypothetical protein